MLYTVAVVFVLLWLLGFVSHYTLNGFIHLLLLLALITVLVNFFQGRGKKAA